MSKQTRTISESAAGFWVDLDGDDAELASQSPLVKQASNFVAPLRQSPTPAQPTQGFDLAMMTPIAHQSLVTDASDEHTRARGFVLRTGPLSFAFAATVGALVWLGGGAWWALPAAFVVFAVVWAVAFAMSMNRSPAGIAWKQSTSMWKILENEQKHRHAQYWANWHDERNRR